MAKTLGFAASVGQGKPGEPVQKCIVIEKKIPAIKLVEQPVKDIIKQQKVDKPKVPEADLIKNWFIRKCTP